jgi:DNA-directed RNA polymerase subunit RPC12/RpoP
MRVFISVFQIWFNVYLLTSYMTRNQNKTRSCLQPRSTLYWLVHNSDAYIQQGANLDALDMHISNKKFSSLVLEFETIENPNKHTQIDEKDKSTTWPHEHICRICSSVFKTEAEYLEHKSRKHSAPYLCSTCGKSFTRHSSLIEHNKQHSDKKETCPP